MLSTTGLGTLGKAVHEARLGHLLVDVGFQNGILVQKGHKGGKALMVKISLHGIALLADDAEVSRLVELERDHFIVTVTGKTEWLDMIKAH